MKYAVVRQFERHDGKALRVYPRGTILSQNEASKIPSLLTLKAANFIQEVPEYDHKQTD